MSESKTPKIRLVDEIGVRALMAPEIFYKLCFRKSFIEKTTASLTWLKIIEYT